MSIQSIETTQYNASSGVKIEKKMLPGSFGMLMDLVQKNQYSNPTHSTVRELAANAEDSIKEKQIARSILEGKAKPEDFYVIKEDMDSDKYSESRWSPEYYDLKYLDPEDRVDIFYHVNEENSLGYCDKLEIVDNGVGLSLRRIIVTTMLGQSTKRLHKDLLGAYGFGAKAALSTDCGYYDVFSNYNGKKFAVRCFERHIEDLTPERNSNFELNPRDEYEGISLRYVKTSEFNGVRIVIPARRFNKSKFIDAVREQLLYFNHVKFSIVEGDLIVSLTTKARILMETDYFVISDQNIYRRPHILITPNPKERNSNMVCYGYIDFEELEYPDTYGSIGVKCPIYAESIDPETGEKIIHPGVTVTPSREQVRQGDSATRSFIREVFVNKVKKEAENFVEKTLSEIEDLIEWFKAVQQVLQKRAGSYGNRYLNITSTIEDQENILRTLANIVDFKTLNLEFKNSGIFFSSLINLMFPGIRVYSVTKKATSRVFSKRLSKYVDKIEIERKELKNTSDLEFNKALWFLKSPGEAHNHMKDKFLLTKYNEFFTFEFFDSDNTTQEMMPKELLEQIRSIKKYEDVVIDENFKKEDENLEEDFLEFEELQKLSPAERRKMADLILVTSFNTSGFNIYDPTRIAYWSENTKMEISRQELENLEGRVYYLFEDEIPLLRVVYVFCKEIMSLNKRADIAFYTDEIKFIKISREVAKTLTKAKHITEFFNQVNEGVFIMDDILKRWNTARIIANNLKQLEFLTNFADISAEYSEIYKELKRYKESFYWDNSIEMFNTLAKKTNFLKLEQNFIKILDKLFELQEFSELQSEEIVEEALGNKFKNVFGVSDANVVEYDKICKLRTLLEFSEEICDLLNCHEKLTTTSRDEMTDKEITAVKEYINFKKQTKL